MPMSEIDNHPRETPLEALLHAHPELMLIIKQFDRLTAGRTRPIFSGQDLASLFGQNGLISDDGSQMKVFATHSPDRILKTGSSLTTSTESHLAATLPHKNNPYLGQANFKPCAVVDRIGGGLITDEELLPAGAACVVETLRRAHQRGVCLHDIQITSVLVDAQTRQAGYVDFNLGFLLPEINLVALLALLQRSAQDEEARKILGKFYRKDFGTFGACTMWQASCQRVLPHLLEAVEREAFSPMLLDWQLAEYFEFDKLIFDPVFEKIASEKLKAMARELKYVKWAELKERNPVARLIESALSPQEAEKRRVMRERKLLQVKTVITKLKTVLAKIDYLRTNYTDSEISDTTQVYTDLLASIFKLSADGKLYMGQPAPSLPLGVGNVDSSATFRIAIQNAAHGVIPRTRETTESGSGTLADAATEVSGAMLQSYWLEAAADWETFFHEFIENYSSMQNKINRVPRETVEMFHSNIIAVRNHARRGDFANCKACEDRIAWAARIFTDHLGKL